MVKVNDSSRISPLSYFKKVPNKSYIASPYRSFSRLLLLSILTIFTSVAAFNWVIDPYGIFNGIKQQGLNHNKPKKLDNDRLFKTADIIHLKPATILLGSSRMRQGMNPEYVELQKYPPVYNLGLNGSNIYELRKYLEHSLVNNPDLKVVVLGIDFFMFNGERELQIAFDENRLNKFYIVPNDLLNTLFSLTALTDSKNTVLTSIKTRQDTTISDYGKLGFLPYRNLNPERLQGNFQLSIRQYFDFHNQYTLSPDLLDEYRKIVEICQKKGIDLKVFISPAHAVQWETIATTGEWETFEQWKREIVKIHPVWDFADYNSITTENLDKNMKNYTDSSHYTPAVGDLVINRLFKVKTETLPPDFGVFITEENIEKHLESNRQSRQKWQGNHPEEIELVKQVYQDFNQQKTTK